MSRALPRPSPCRLLLTRRVSTSVRRSCTRLQWPTTPVILSLLAHPASSTSSHSAMGQPSQFLRVDQHPLLTHTRLEATSPWGLQPKKLFTAPSPSRTY